MNLDKMGGAIIVLAIVISIALAGYSSLTSSADGSDDLSNNMTLTQAQLNQTLSQNGTANNITTINLNINQKEGGIDFKFAGMDDVCNIHSNDNSNSTNISYDVNDNGELDINISSNDSDKEIILNDKYAYNINGKILTGGANANVSANAKINSLIIETTTGGVNIDLNGGYLTQADINAVVGGINIQGMPSGQTSVNANVTVGGVSLQLDEPAYNVNSHTELGGSQVGNISASPDCQYTQLQYSTSDNKLDINSYVQVGGFYSN